MKHSKLDYIKRFVSNKFSNEVVFEYNPLNDEIEETLFGEFWEHPKEDSIKNKMFNVVVSLNFIII